MGPQGPQGPAGPSTFAALCTGLGYSDETKCKAALGLVKIVFRTNAIYDGNLQALFPLGDYFHAAQANVCQKEASEAGLPGRYDSVSNTAGGSGSAITKLDLYPQVVLASGDVVADNLRHLFDTTRNIYVPIYRDASGIQQPFSTGSGQFTWTGLVKHDPSGSAYQMFALGGDQCNHWRSANGYGAAIGYANSRDANRFSAHNVPPAPQAVACSGRYAFYCIQQ